MALNTQPEPASSEAESSPASRRHSWARLCAFLLFVLLAIVLVTALARALPSPPRRPFDRASRTRLAQTHPAFVLLGNSMVGTRFDEATLRQLLHPRRVSVLGLSASKSAVWYLVLKNLVVFSGAHPRTLLFFRDEELTDPRARTAGPAHAMLEGLSVDDEPTVERKIAPPLVEPIAWLEWERARAMPFDRLHMKTDPLLDQVGDLGSRLFWRPAEQEHRKDQLNDLFALANLRVADVAQEPTLDDTTHVFKTVVARSFLPDMCELAKANDIPLTFIRVRTRAAAAGGVEAAPARQYIADLERYVRACGAEFYDMHDAAWESLDMYGNGDHIAGRYKRAYTALFVQHMAQVFH